MDERTDDVTVGRPPRPRPATIAAGAGVLWGSFCYSVLWEGTPFEVDRRFFESIAGALFLLPARLVLWSVHAIESASDRTFDLSRSTWIFAAASALAGLLLGVLVLLATRGVLAIVRR